MKSRLGLIIAVLSCVGGVSLAAERVIDPVPVEIQCRATSAVPYGEEISIECGEDGEGEPKSAEKGPLRPSRFSVILQTGGYAGLVSPGMSFRFLKRNEVALLGGYVPFKVNGSRPWQLNFKYQIEPINDLHIRLKNGERIAINPIHLGAGVIYGIHKDLFLRLPSQYPSGYYNSTALRYTFNVGTSAAYRRVTFSVDYSALDVSAISYFWDGNAKFYRDNYAAFGLAGIGTLGFGVKLNLNRSQAAVPKRSHP